MIMITIYIIVFVFCFMIYQYVFCFDYYVPRLVRLCCFFACTYVSKSFIS